MAANRSDLILVLLLAGCGRYSRNGVLLRRFRFAAGFPIVAVSAEDREHRIEDALATLEGGMVDHMRPFFENMAARTHLPPYDRMVTDAVGDLWVEHYRHPGMETNSWTMFDNAGVVLGQVSVPARFEILDVGSDYVLGRWRDDFDVEHIQLYRLIKEATAS